jgi:hypothetical protein
VSAGKKIMADKSLFKKLSESINFDPHSSFVELRIVRITVYCFAIMSLANSILIVCFSNLKFRFDHIGFNNFVDFFKVPLGTLALLIPIMALLATNHRSVQTKEQIRISNLQNNFINHFKRVEEFEKYCKREGSHASNRVTNARSLYSVIYPESMNGDYSISEAYNTALSEFLQNVVEHSALFKSGDMEKYIEAINKINLEIMKFGLFGYMGLNEIEVRVFNYNGKEAGLRSGNLEVNMREVSHIVSAVVDVLSFEPGYKPYGLLEKTLNMNFTKLPDIRLNEHNQFINLDQISKFDLNDFLEREDARNNVTSLWNYQ